MTDPVMVDSHHRLRSTCPDCKGQRVTTFPLFKNRGMWWRCLNCGRRKKR